MSILPAATEGMRKAEERLQRVAERLAGLPAAGDGTSPVDVVEWSAEAVALLEARHAHAANAETARAADEAERAVLDILA